MRERGVLTGPTPSLLDLSLMLTETYVKYPVASADFAVIPYNYCMLPKLFEGRSKFLEQLAEKVMSFIC